MFISWVLVSLGNPLNECSRQILLIIGYRGNRFTAQKFVTDVVSGKQTVNPKNRQSNPDGLIVSVAISEH